MANVRETDGIDDRIFLNGGGGTLAGWGLMVVCRLVALTGTQAVMSAVDTPSTTQGVLYYDATNELAFGSTVADESTTAFTLNSTDVWNLGFTKAAGSTTVRFHARNLTTGAAGAHGNATAGPGNIADAGGTWDQTEIGSADGGTFFGNKRYATGAIFTSVYSDANFDSVLTSTAQIAALSPSRLWDFNQAAVGTHVNNVLTGTDDQVSIVGTTVVSDAAFDFWTFGLGAAAADPMVRTFTPIPLMR